MGISRRRLGIAGAVGALALGAAAVGGVVWAQTVPSSTPSASQTQSGQAGAAQAATNQFIQDLATNLGISPDTLTQALKTTASQEVDKAVAAGKLTAEQGQNIKNRIANGQGPLLGPLPFGRMGPGAALGQNLQAIRQTVQNALTQALPGESLQQLQADLHSGMTLDQIAQAHGTTAQAVRDAVASTVQSQLDALVAQGQITQQQADALVNAIKNGRGIPGLGGGGPFRGPHGHRGGDSSTGSSSGQNGGNAPTQ